MKWFAALVRAIWNREPGGHISDLWGEFTGKLVLCGRPPNQYLLLKRYWLKQKAKDLASTNNGPI